MRGDRFGFGFLMVLLCFFAPYLSGILFNFASSRSLSFVELTRHSAFSFQNVCFTLTLLEVEVESPSFQTLRCYQTFRPLFIKGRMYEGIL